jgi:hypothetical protein
MEALTIATVWTLNEAIRKSSIGLLGPQQAHALEIEIDHFPHDQNARRHPDDGAGEHYAAERRGP